MTQYLELQCSSARPEDVHLPDKEKEFEAIYHKARTLKKHQIALESDGGHSP